MTYRISGSDSEYTQAQLRHMAATGSLFPGHLLSGGDLPAPVAASSVEWIASSFFATKAPTTPIMRRTFSTKSSGACRLLAFFCVSLPLLAAGIGLVLAMIPATREAGFGCIAYAVAGLVGSALLAAALSALADIVESLAEIRANTRR